MRDPHGSRRRRAAPALLVLAALAARSAPVHAQPLPSEPLTFGGGRLIVSGEASAAAAAQADTGFFNYTDYEHNALRLVRLSALAAWHVADRVTLLGEARTENFSTLRAYALYARVRPWRGRALDVQAGRIPPTFGAFARRSYGADNLLVGYPLAYQYLTPLRPDALPATVDDVLRMRGRGWLASYPIGNPAPAPGLPLMSAFRWDTGIQVRAGGRPVEASAALTTGTLGNPLVRNDNGGRQLAGRLALRPSPGLVAGLSAARGPALSRDAVHLAAPGAPDNRFPQESLGLDVEYSRDYWLLRGEAVFTTWQLPDPARPGARWPLRAGAVSAEGRYRLSPRLYVAGRADRLGFSRLTGTDGVAAGWDAPVTRVEAGVGYLVQRHVRLALVYQHNWRDGGRIRTRGFLAGHLLYWF